MGDFLNWLTMFFTGAAVVVAWMCARAAERADAKPVLAFSHNGKERGWVVTNVGKGPALNLTIGPGDHDRNWDPQQSIDLAALACGEAYALDWIVNPRALVATYEDAMGDAYTVECIDNRNRPFKRNRYQGLKGRLRPWHVAEMRHKRDAASPASPSASPSSSGDTPAPTPKQAK